MGHAGVGFFFEKKEWRYRLILGLSGCQAVVFVDIAMDISTRTSKLGEGRD